jgi:hypothetical protein
MNQTRNVSGVPHIKVFPVNILESLQKPTKNPFTM